MCIGLGLALPRVEVQISGMDTLNMVPLLTSCSQRADIEIIINRTYDS